MRLKHLAVAVPSNSQPSSASRYHSASTHASFNPPSSRRRRVHGNHSFTTYIQPQQPSASATFTAPNTIYAGPLISPMPARVVATTTDKQQPSTIREADDPFTVPLLKSLSIKQRKTVDAGIQTGASLIGNEIEEADSHAMPPLRASPTAGCSERLVQYKYPSPPGEFPSVCEKSEHKPTLNYLGATSPSSGSASASPGSTTYLGSGSQAPNMSLAFGQFRCLSPIMMTHQQSTSPQATPTEVSMTPFPLTPSTNAQPAPTHIPPYPGNSLRFSRLLSHDGVSGSEAQRDNGITSGSGSSPRELAASPLAAVHRQRQSSKGRTVKIASPVLSSASGVDSPRSALNISQSASPSHASQPRQAHFTQSPLASYHSKLSSDGRATESRSPSRTFTNTARQTPARSRITTEGSPSDAMSSMEKTQTFKSVEETPFYTPAPIPTPKKFDLNHIARWNAMLEDVRNKADHQDCRVPHAILVNLQNEILDNLADIDLEPVFLMQSVLNGSKAVPLAPLSNRNNKASTGLLVSTKDITSMAKRLRIIDDVLSESCVAFFERYQELRGTPINVHGTPQEQIDQFLKDVGRGPSGGRKSIGNPVTTCEHFPVAIFGTGKYDPSMQKNLRKPAQSGAARWTTYCTPVSPIRVSVCFKSSSLEAVDLEESEGLYIGELADLLGRICSDWRCHRMRLFESEARRFQIFLPLISRMPAAELVALGWGDMRFDGGNIIRWKTIQGGVILAFIAGVAEANVDEAMALVNDGDSHKDWIPFLSETKRCFSVTPYQFVFSYGVNLPWPLSKRELVFMGMATDALLISPLHAIQMWGFNVPEVATTMFGIPCPEKSSANVTSMEMPILSFSLSPMGPRRTYVMMVAVMDVKINFLPQSVQNYMAKHMATKMFGNVQRLCKNFRNTPYQQVLEENREPFGLLMANVPVAQTQFKKPTV